MSGAYQVDQTFQHDISDILSTTDEFEGCTFRNCHLSEANLNDKKFIDCEFIASDLSMAKMNKASFRDCVFNNCKMLGLRFDACTPFGLAVEFNDCILNNSSFFQCKLPKTRFTNCSLIEVDFAEAQLAESHFDNCDMSGAVFDQTNLEKADLRTAFNYHIHPENNRIKRAKFSATGISGLLQHLDISIEP